MNLPGRDKVVSFEETTTFSTFKSSILIKLKSTVLVEALKNSEPDA